MSPIIDTTYSEFVNGSQNHATAMKDGSALVIRSVPEIQRFRNALFEYVRRVADEEDVTQELADFYESGRLPGVEAAKGIFLAFSKVHSDRFVAEVFANLISRLELEGTILIQGRLSGLMLSAFEYSPVTGSQTSKPSNIHEFGMWFPLHELNYAPSENNQLADLALKFGDAVLFPVTREWEETLRKSTYGHCHAGYVRFISIETNQTEMNLKGFHNINNFVSHQIKWASLLNDYSSNDDLFGRFVREGSHLSANYFWRSLESRIDAGWEDCAAVFDIYGHYPFAEDRYLALADMVGHVAPEVATACLDKVIKTSKNDRYISTAIGKTKNSGSGELAKPHLAGELMHF